MANNQIDNSDIKCSPARCIHMNLVTREDAEKVLSEDPAAKDGSFLIRPSRNNPGCFTLCIREDGGRVRHIRINSTGDGYYLEGAQNTTYTTLIEMVKYFVKQSPFEMNLGTKSIYLKEPLRTEDKIKERYFHGAISANEAKEELMTTKTIGYYLVRESNRHPGSYALSCTVPDGNEGMEIQHFLIRKEEDKGRQFYSCNSKRYKSVNDVIIDFGSKGYYIEKSDKNFLLKFPFNASTILNASGIHDRVVQMSKEKAENPLVPVELGFWEEFRDLTLSEIPEHLTTKIAERQENCLKNRYKNILPYDNTLVLLDKDPKINGSEYINANYLTSDENFIRVEKKFIATQGPMSHTIIDFWRMVWQENIRVIVMVTPLMEKEKKKCEKYWPEINQDIIFTTQKGQYKITTKSEKNMNDQYVLREFQMSLSNFPPHKVYQFHSITWPDHGVIENPGDILGFIEDINKKQKSIVNPGPPLVHCSAGIGRTGSLIVLDMLIEKVKEQGLNTPLDIYNTIRILRRQRPGLVQTADQYRFIYNVLDHYIDTLMRRLKESKKQEENDVVYANLS